MSEKTKKASSEELMREIRRLKAEIEELKNKPTTVARVSKGQPRPDVYYSLLVVPTHGLPPQAIVCAKALATAEDPTRIPEAEAMALIAKARADGKLRTKQDAWHIFQYYRPRLIERDFLRMLQD